MALQPSNLEARLSQATEVTIVKDSHGDSKYRLPDAVGRAPHPCALPPKPVTTVVRNTSDRSQERDTTNTRAVLQTVRVSKTRRVWETSQPGGAQGGVVTKCCMGPGWGPGSGKGLV